MKFWFEKKFPKNIEKFIILEHIQSFVSNISPEHEAFVINEKFPCIMGKYGNVVITVPTLLLLPVYFLEREKYWFKNICGLLVVDFPKKKKRCNFFTCIEVDMSGAHFSSLITLPTLLCTFTNAFISFDSNRFFRKPSSCSLDKLSASFNDVTNFDKTKTNDKEKKKEPYDMSWKSGLPWASTWTGKKKSDKST